MTVGWVLHRRPWRESSLLVDLLSESHGRIGLVARGGRSERSIWRGVLEPFSPLSIHFTIKGEMGTVKDVELIGDRYGLSGDALWCGLYVNELLMCLLDREEAMPGLVKSYGDLMDALVNPDDQMCGLRRFEWSLLEQLGVAPDLHMDATGEQPILGNQLYRLEIDYGFVPAESRVGTVVSGDALVWLRGDLPKGLGDEDARAIRQVNRVLLDHQLGGRTLRTREMMRALR